jgi:molybdate transport system substrate-binding protein
MGNIGRVFGLFAAAIALCFASGCDGDDGADNGKGGAQTLTVLCGAGIRPAMEELKTAFEKQSGCTVRVNYAGSGTLLGQLQSTVDADVYVPGDISWIERGREKGLIGSSSVVAWFVPVLAVQKGNPKVIKGLADLARSELNVGLGNAEACAVGAVSRDLLNASGLSDRVKPDYEALTVNRLANQVKLKSLDVALIWDATAAQYDRCCLG